jgi:hypothetical protein
MESIKIPIAEDCYSTFYLRDNGLRFESYYFDWLVLSPDTVLSLFKTGFSEFFIKENLKVVGKHGDVGDMKFKKAEIYVQDTLNDIFYLHHFNDIDKDFLGLKERFDRKINRMNQHFKDNRVIEFYFKPTKYEHWKKLTSKSWGENEMDRVFPLLRDFIATKYNYKNKDDIKLVKLC